jgi:hypothetical protein
LFLNIVSLCSSFNMGDYVSRSFKTAGNVTIYIF